MTRPRPPWCGSCDEKTRLTDEPRPKRCPVCHPLGKRAMSADPEAVPLISDGLISLSAVTERRATWLWPGRLPVGHLVMLDGDPGVGKSTLSLDFAARVSTGAPWPDGQPCKQGGVLLMTAEEGLAETVVPRLLLAGGDLNHIVVLDHIPGADGVDRLPALPVDVPYIQQIIIQRRIRLLIIDVLASYLGGDGALKNAHGDTDVRRALFPIFKMAQTTRSTVLMLRHLNKSDNKIAMYRGGGSIAIMGQARAGYLAAEDPESYDGRRLFAGIKNNLAPIAPTLAYSLLNDEESGCAAVQWHGEDPHMASELLGVQLGAEEAEEQDHTVSWIQDYLYHCGGTATGGAVITAATKAGYAKATVQRARKRARVSYRRGGWQGGTVWVLDPVRMAELKEASPPGAEPDKAPVARAGCPACKQPVQIRLDGRFRLHRIDKRVCAASGQFPATERSEKSPVSLIKELSLFSEKEICQ